MYFRILILSFFLVFFSIKCYGEPDSSIINNKRLVITSSSLALSLGASYYYIENSWWSDQSASFHFDQGQDQIYALNVDKCGHFLGGIHSSNVFKSAMKWTGMSERRSLLYAGFFGSALQLAIELKDAYSPYWGFSKWDFSLGSAGAFYPLLQNKYSDLDAVNFKFSYFRHSDSYFKLEEIRGKEISKYNWQDDYPNQTYWITVNIDHFFQTCCFPDWLNVALGFGIDDTQYLNNRDQKVGGNNEWYIALDYDLEKALKKWNTPLARNIKHWLNYIHFPAPAIKISPKIEFFPLFL